MKLEIKFLVTLCLLAVGIGSATYYVSLINIHKLSQQQALEYADSIEKKFENLKEQDIRMLSLGISFFIADADIKDVFLTKDRDQLYQKTYSIFKEIQKNYNVTHFNFIYPDGTVFLRLQDPSTFDDIISRQSFLDAVSSHKIESSLELGKNSFALRTVSPYYNDDHLLIGYVELAREMGNFLESLKYETGDEFVIYGKKSFLKYDDYIASIERKNISTTWDEFPEDVSLATTTSSDIMSECLSKTSISDLTQKDSSYKEVQTANHTFLCTGFSVRNSKDQIIATIITAHDITSIISTNKKIFFIQLFVITIIFIIFVIIFYILLRHFVIRPVRELTTASASVALGHFDYKTSYSSSDEIGELSALFNTMLQKLKNYQDELTKESQKLQMQVKEITSKNQQIDVGQHATVRALDEAKTAKILSDVLAHDLEKFKLAADSTSDFIVITDSDGKIIYANTAAEKISGLTHKEIFDTNHAVQYFWGGYTNNDAYQNMWKTIKIKKEPFSGSIKNTTKYNTEYYAKISIAPILDALHNVIFFVGIGKDITQEKEIDMAKDNFISLVSHQLRTPLTSIKWLIELLLDPKTGKLTKKQKKFLDATHTSANRLALLISDILSINRIEMGRITIILTPTNIISLTNDIISEMAPQFKEKFLILTTQYEENVPLISTDPVLIRQVIMNIFSNAIKYTPENGTIKFLIKNADMNNIEIKISDSGIGIPFEEQKKIFERFFRATNVQSKFTEGTGLGLFIAKMIVNMCGGTIGFQSQLNHGTTIWFTLPIKNKKHN